MKNEKLCFDKKIGVIIFIGALVVLGISASSTLLKTKTSTNSRASGPTSIPIQSQLGFPQPLTDLEAKNLPYVRNETADIPNFSLYNSLTKSIGCGYVQLLNSERVLYKECPATQMCTFSYSSKSMCLNTTNIANVYEIHLGKVDATNDGYIFLQPDSNGIYHLPANEINKYYLTSDVNTGKDTKPIITVAKYKSTLEIDNKNGIVKTDTITNSIIKTIFNNMQLGLDIQPVSLGLLNEGNHNLSYTLSISDNLIGEYKYTQSKVFSIIVEGASQRR